MLTATSPVLLNDDNPYKVPFALGLLLETVVLVLFLVGTGFLLVLGFDVGFVLGFVVLVGGFGLGVGFAFPLSDFNALPSAAFWICSTGFSLLGLSTLLFFSVSLDAILSLVFSALPARAAFFFLLDVFLETILNVNEHREK